MIDEINNAKPELEEAGIELKEEWLKAIRVNEEDPMKLSQINFDEIIKAIGNKLPKLKMLLQKFQKMYNNLSPQESHVQFARERLQQIVSGLGGDMDIMQKYLMKGGEDWKTYVKRIKEEMDAEILKLQQLRRERAETAKYGLLSKIMGSPSEDDIKNRKNWLKNLKLYIMRLSHTTLTKMKKAAPNPTRACKSLMRWFSLRRN